MRNRTDNTITQTPAIGRLFIDMRPAWAISVIINNNNHNMYMVTGQIHINIIIIVMATRVDKRYCFSRLLLSFIVYSILFYIITLSRHCLWFQYALEISSSSSSSSVDCAECVCRRRLQCNMSPLYLIDGWLALLVVYGVLCEGGILSVEQKKRVKCTALPSTYIVLTGGL